MSVSNRETKAQGTRLIHGDAHILTYIRTTEMLQAAHHAPLGEASED